MSTIESFKILYSYTGFEYSLSLISAMLLKYVTHYSRKSLRVLGSVGEPINPSAWRCVNLLPTGQFVQTNYKRSHVCFTSDGSTILLEIPGAPYQTPGGKLKLAVSW
jgi:hypothetical protein